MDKGKKERKTWGKEGRGRKNRKFRIGEEVEEGGGLRNRKGVFEGRGVKRERGKRKEHRIRKKKKENLGIERRKVKEKVSSKGEEVEEDLEIGKECLREEKLVIKGKEV